MKALIPLLLFTLTVSTTQANEISAKVEKKSLLVKCDSQIKRLPINKQNDLEVEGQPKIFEKQGFNLIIVELADHNSGTSYVYAIDKDCKALWTYDLKSFNPSVPLIEDNFVYLGAVGNVYKLHKKSGKVVWSHQDLYKKFKFNGADPILRDGEFIKFSNNLAVIDQTGKVKVLNK